MPTRKKTDKTQNAETKHTDRNNPNISPRSFDERDIHDWRPLFARLEDTFDWALDIAVALADGDQDDIDAIERVRDYLHSWLDGDPIDIDTNDILTTLAIVFAAIELDSGIDSSPILRAMHGLPVALHLPGSSRTRHGDPTVVIRMPRRRNASDGSIYFAAA